jgi:hypothetical protein
MGNSSDGVGAAVMECLTDFVGLIPTHPLLFAAVIIALVGVGFVVWALSTAVMRTALRKFYYLARGALSADLPRDLIYWLVIGVCIALPIALIRGYGQGGDSKFHWGEFLGALGIVAVGNAFRAMFTGLSAGRKILRPVHGGVWRTDRKIKTAAILQKINALLEAPSHDIQQVRRLIEDLLDVAVSHVRDYRGNHKSVDVFANLLLVDGEDLVVVARDPNLTNSKDLKRTTPARYAKATLAAGRAIEARAAVAVGDYHLEYPELPKNKPYRSVLAIPLMPKPDQPPIGALCIDSSQPYFFESFTPGAVENDLDNSLAPYVHTLLLALEALLSRRPSEMLAFLLRPHEATGKRDAIDDRNAADAGR